MKRLSHKFHAKPQKIEGRHFASKAEAAYYHKLKAAQTSGDLLFFLRQVPLDLPGSTKYIVDFLEFWSDGSILFTDVKGFETEVFKIKLRQVHEMYPFEINIVKKVV